MSSNRRCYAACLGDCTVISQEHIVTRAIFGDAKSIEVFNSQRWPNGKRIGINSAGANILCKAHNSNLGILDDEVLKLANACATFWDSPKNGSIAIDGRLIERWMLKVVIGISASGEVGKPMLPSDSAVRQLFGLDPLMERFALYGLSGIRMTREWNRSVSYHFFFNNQVGEVDMGLFMVNCLPLLAYVGDHDVQAGLRTLETTAGIDVRQATVTRRPRTMQLSHPDDSDLHLSIQFSYSEQL